jgi:uncharacterized lipoprotein YmbA
MVAMTAIAIALFACGETKPSRFYMLSAEPASDTRAQGTKAGGIIAVGPVEIPKYLDRSQIVTVTEPNRVNVADYDRWAEPLDVAFTRTLAENLQLMTAARLVEVYPFPASAALDPSERQVVVQIMKFHLRSDGVVDFAANWSILDQEGRRTLLRGSSTASEPATVGDYTSATLAMSRVVATFSQEIATAYNSLAVAQR